MRIAVTGRKLHQAQAVTLGAEAHCFAVNCDNAAKIKTLGQVAFMQSYRHISSSSPDWPISCHYLLVDRQHMRPLRLCNEINCWRQPLVIFVSPGGCAASLGPAAGVCYICLA
jgi:hypothetical protein